jgi:hypothetical protein
MLRLPVSMSKQAEPPRPSTRLSRSGHGLPMLAAFRKTESQKLPKLVRGELDWIAMKALDKDRGRRYATANALAADVQRYLKDETVEACPPSASYRLRKYLRKHKAAMGMVGTAAALLLLGALASGWQAWRSRPRASIGVTCLPSRRRRLSINLGCLRREGLGVQCLAMMNSMMVSIGRSFRAPIVLWKDCWALWKAVLAMA